MPLISKDLLCITLLVNTPLTARSESQPAPQRPLLTTFTTPDQTSSQMSNNNRQGQVLALIGTEMNIRVENIQKTFYTESGPRTETSRDIQFENSDTQLIYNNLQTQYETVFNQELNVLNEKTSLENNGIVSLTDHLKNTNTVIQNIGQSPMSIILNYLEMNINMYKKQEHEYKRTIPEFRNY